MHPVLDLNRWRRGVQCRKEHDTCPHSERHWHPAVTGARADIQGLRAFAVIVVILDHLTNWPRGGFVGVDMFFVISGFLITGILVRRHEKTQHISFVWFYRRRIRRILPAAVLVLFATVVVSRLVFLEDRWRSTVVDSVWALLFSANWRFASLGTDYFARDLPPSPVQHYWSLSIEEQFYFVWPWLMLGIFTLLAGRASAKSSRVAIFAAITVATVASFTWAVYRTNVDPTVAYFSSFTRIWELGVGAMLAVAAPLCDAIPTRLRPVLAWLGLAGMVTSIFIISESSGFPAPAAALPVLSTALVIAAGTTTDQKWRQPFFWPMTARGTTYVGDISYSLYLWHFPVIVILAAYMGAEGWQYYALAVALIIGLSVASFHMVEDPLRQSPLLETMKRRDWREWSDTWAATYRYGGIAVLAALVAVVVSVAVTPTQPPTTAAAVDFRGALGGGNATGAGLSKAESQLQDDIATALQAKSWPKLNPPLDQLETAGSPVEETAGCGSTDFADPSSCSFGDPSKPTMVVLGDSTGITLLPTVRAAYGDDYYIRGFTKAGCPIPVEEEYASETDKVECDQHRAAALAEVAKVKPDVVFIIDAYSVGDLLASGAEGDAITEEWQTGMQKVVDQVSKDTKKVVLVSPAPKSADLTECATTRSVPSDCVTTVYPSYNLVRTAEKAIKGPGVHYLDTSLWFCSQDQVCPPFIGDTPVRRDTVHPTRQWAETIAPLFKARTERWLKGTAGRA